jgi:hypothetical protein
VRRSYSPAFSVLKVYVEILRLSSSDSLEDDTLNLISGWVTPPAFCMDVKTKRLRDKGFVRV